MKNTYKEIMEMIDPEDDIVILKTIWGEIVYIWNAYSDIRQCSGEERIKKLIFLDRQITFYFSQKQRK